MEFYCDNQAMCDIVNNAIQHDWTKHVKVNHHFVKEKLVEKLINITFVKEKLVEKNK